MGADTSVTHMIFFVAAIIVAGSMAGVFLTVGYNVAVSIDHSSDALSEQMNTGIRIINDPAMMPYTGNNLSVYVENTGTELITPSTLAIMLDGIFINDSTSQIMGGGARWGPSVVLQINIVEPLASGDHYVKIVTKSGVSDTLAFRL
jgi:archaeal flagellar protein FlaG